jgi:hypothetical protein
MQGLPARKPEVLLFKKNKFYLAEDLTSTTGGEKICMLFHMAMRSGKKYTTNYLS